MQTSWQGAEGTLDERFTYSDGTTSQRIWYLTDLGQGRYSGRADDVIGTAEGQTAGNAFRWAYTLALPVDGKVWDINFNDWMYQLDDRRVLNRAEMTKFGFKVGEVTLWIERNI